MNANRKIPGRHLVQLTLLVLFSTMIGLWAGIPGETAQAGPRPTKTPTSVLTATPAPTKTPGTNPTPTPRPTRPGQTTATPTSTGNPSATPTPVPNPDGAWEIVDSPNTGSPHNYFNGMAAISANDVWTVGAYGDTNTRAEQLIQHWDGQSWTMVAAPTLPTTFNELMAVSAVSTDDVWAVGSGDGFGLIEHWDGISWSVVSHPNPGVGNRFFGVAAIASNDVWAVGYQVGEDGLSKTLIERWDGNSWTVVPSPNVPNQHNSLFAVTAVPGSPNKLWAVGRADPSKPFIMQWNGTDWSIVTVPSAGSVPLLYGVTAISANDVWAVGWTSFGSGPVTLTMRWNGSTWSVVPSPNPSSTYNYLWAVDASAANNVWAVGDFNALGGHQQNLLLKWNGTAWVQFPGDNTAPDGDQFFLRAVTALNASDAWIGGQFSGHALAEHWNGSVWSQVSAPNAGVGSNILNGVSGTSATDVWQVGFYWFGTENRTLIQHWDGTDWSIVPSPNEYVRLNTLNGVFAISPSDAWAVGSDSSGNGPDQTTLALHWNGTSWSIVPSPSPGTFGLNNLYGVAANAANDVWAVGSFTNVGEYSKTLILHWNGSSWSIVPSPNAPGLNNELYGVVALGPNDVWAVGYKGVVDFETLILHWNGSNWSIVTSPNASGSSILSAVSGTGANDVWTVGRTRNPFNFQTGTLIEHWNGNLWEAVFGFGGSGPDHALYGVAAVSPGDAWAVGDSGGLALIGRWDGDGWITFPSPAIAGRLYAATTIGACDVWAVGQRYVEGVGFLTLSERFTCD